MRTKRLSQGKKPPNKIFLEYTKKNLQKFIEKLDRNLKQQAVEGERRQLFFE